MLYARLNSDGCAKENPVTLMYELRLFSRTLFAWRDAITSLLISSGKESFRMRFLLDVPDSRKGSTWGSSLFHTRFLLGVPDLEIRSCVLQRVNYHHLTIEERCCIREFYKNGKSFREIAVLVGRNVSTISREINRNKSFMNCKPAYYPHTTQKKYLLRRSFCHRGMFWNKEVIDYINDKLRNTWSPEQIANTSWELKLPSFKTIYRWIYEKYLVNGDVKVLRKKGKTRKRLGNGGRFTTGKSIRKRDKSVYKRKSSVIGKRIRLLADRAKQNIVLLPLPKEQLDIT